MRHAGLAACTVVPRTHLLRPLRKQALKAGNRDNGSRLVGFAASNSEYVEHVFKQDTVGLQTKEQFAEKARSEAAGRGKRAETGLSPRTPLTRNAPQRANVEREVEAQRQRAARAQEESEQQALSRKRAAAKVVATARLSFVDPDAEEEAPEEEEEDEGARDAPAAGKVCALLRRRIDVSHDVCDLLAQDAKRPRFGALGKNPTVETSFLPDAAREREEREERELLKGAWLEQQARQKAQPLSITYSYWDGSGHRRALVVRTGDTVGTFLRAVRDALAPEFRELKAASADQMLYVKEDLIIPHVRTGPPQRACSAP